MSGFNLSQTRSSTVLEVLFKTACVATALLLSACGGSSSSAPAAAPTENGSPVMQQPVGGEPIADAGTNPPVDDSAMQGGDDTGVEVESDAGQPGGDVGSGGDVEQTPIDNSTDTAGDNGSATSNQNSAGVFFFMEEGQPAPGADGRLLSGNAERRVNLAGDFVQIGRLEEDRFTPNRDGLWGGSVFDPQVLLLPDDTLDGFPANIRVSGVSIAALGSTGDVAAIVNLSGAQNQTALAYFADGQEPITIASTAEAIEVPGDSLTLNNIQGVAVEQGTVAFNAEFASFQSVLFRSVGGEISLVAPEAASRNERAFDLSPLLADGCRLLFVPQDQFGIRDTSYGVSSDGSIYFDATIVVEADASSNPAICPRRFLPLDPNGSQPNRVGENFSSVVRYTSSGEYQRVVSRGDPVPGLEAVFESVAFSSVLSDGSVLVRAELFSFTGDSRIDSLWVFDNDNAARLLAVSGETVETSLGSIELNIDQFRSGVSIPNPESVTLVQTDNRNSQNEQSWILSGSVNAGQPHSSLEALGASNLQLIVEDGGLAPEGYPDTAFFSGVSTITAKPSGGGYFFGSVVDSTGGGEVLDIGLWQFDTDGVVSPVVLEGDIVVLNEIPRAFENFSGLSFNQGVAAVGDNAVILFQEESNNDRLVYWPVQ